MKKTVMLLVALLTAVAGVYAQTDDMYYRPSKKNKTENTKKEVVTVDQTTYDDYSDDEVDAYNRRTTADNDTLYIGDADEGALSGYDNEYEQEYYGNDYEYTRRMARFHTPSINIYYGFGSPLYWDYYDYAWGWDYYYDPWYYNAYWGWGWSWNYPRYYGWGWYNRPWHYWAWDYRPWHGVGWHDHGGWHHGGGHPGNGGRLFAGQIHTNRAGSAGGRIITSGRNYRDALAGNNSAPSSARNNNSYRGVTSNRSTSTYNRRNTTTRSYGNRSNNSTSTRSYNRSTTRSSSSARQNSTTSTRSYGSSRSFGGSSSIGSRSTGSGSMRSGGGSAGGTRSFGGGGGGGRRR